MSSSSTLSESLGNYKLSKCIGEGTFGKVRLGIHILTNQKVAVKILQKDKIVEQSDIQRVTRQICILKVLRHPNVIQLYEIIETSNAIHLIMEYAEGGELFDYIVRNKRVKEKEAVQFMHQILSGIEYIHKNGIVHRDLKPENLLLDLNKNIKIVDFGLSNLYKSGEKLQTACGSPCYAAPQMIGGRKYQCLNVDIWSCGIILYAMLCGYLPFEDKNHTKLFEKIMTGDFQIPKILSAQAKDIIRNILNVNPETRFKISQIRSSKWFNIVQSEGESAGIIVGKDQIFPQQAIVKKMTKLNFEPNQIRTYVMNNRHNHVTSTYYLLQKKMESQTLSQSFEEKTDQMQFQYQENERKRNQCLKENQNIKNYQIQRREDSPLVYNPNPDKTKQKYISNKRTHNIKKDAKNDSINATHIIASLVEANKTKILAQKNIKKPTEGNFQEFKMLPNKKNSSIYEPNSNQKVNQKRNEEGKSVQIEMKRNSLSREGKKIKGLDSSEERQKLQTNKKRQQLSQQIKKISVQIDKQITQLNKNHEKVEKKKSTEVSLHHKKHSENFSLIKSKQKTKQAQQNSSNLQLNVKQKINSQVNSIEQPGPQIHRGPFNVKCLFNDNALTLIQKIGRFLTEKEIRYVTENAYSLKLLNNNNIWIEKMKGSQNVNLVMFTQNFPLASQILEDLGKQ